MSKIRPPARPAGHSGAFHAPSFAPRGVTLIELMLVIAILALLAAVAVPGFTALVEGWRVRQAAEGLQSSLYHARSEAIRRGGGVILEKLPRGTQGCVLARHSHDWDCGWVLYADANGNGHLDQAEEIQRMDAPAHTTVTRTRAGAAIALDRWGKMDGISALGFTIAPYPRGLASPAAKGVCVAAGGRIRVIDRNSLPCG